MGVLGYVIVLAERIKQFKPITRKVRKVVNVPKWVEEA